MARIVLCLPLAILFLASVIPSKAQKAEAEESRVTVAVGAPLTVECRLRPEQPPEWRRDGAAPPPDLQAAPEAPASDARLAARLRAPAARPHHAGLYTCSRERDHRVRVVVLPAAGTAATAASACAPLACPWPAPPAPAPPPRPQPGAGAGEAPATAAASPAPPAAPAAPAADELPELLYDVRLNFTLHCQLPNENSLTYVW
ncbi:unnamed protein product [Euphydryas editha]|uniref:Ig-like domain-containing protein n=1 Tax=Euphydryas editha TaxID=104508 RepID=A0AAU9TPW8_EUPED|nr:unnamed protein product [Euphydryas editha]